MATEEISPVSSSQLPVILSFGGKDHPTSALLDSGAEGNFLDEELDRSLGIPAVSLSSFPLSYGPRKGSRRRRSLTVHPRLVFLCPAITGRRLCCIF